MLTREARFRARHRRRVEGRRRERRVSVPIASARGGYTLLRSSRQLPRFAGGAPIARARRGRGFERSLRHLSCGTPIARLDPSPLLFLRRGKLLLRPRLGAPRSSVWIHKAEPIERPSRVRVLLRESDGNERIGGSAMHATDHRGQPLEHPPLGRRLVGRSEVAGLGMLREVSGDGRSFGPVPVTRIRCSAIAFLTF